MHARADALTEDAASWPEDIFAVLQRFDVRQVPYVPDAGHSQLIERVLASSSMRGIALTTEEEGVALLAGAWAGGQRGVLLMQSSGVGNCINMLSLTQIFRAATINNAREFKMESEIGTIEPGKVANLVLMKKNPLETVDAYDSITTVFLHGKPIPRETLAVDSEK